jgi:hypothetical protein
MSIRRDLLIEKLRDPELMCSIVSWGEDVRTRASPYFLGDIVTENEDFRGDWIGAVAHVGEYERLEMGFFREFVADLPGPAVVTAQELDELLIQYLGFVDAPGSPHWENLTQVYQHFLFHVEHNLISFHVSEPVLLCRVMLSKIDGAALVDELTQDPWGLFWDSDYLQIKIQRRTSIRETDLTYHDNEEWVPLHIQLQGVVSPNVLDTWWVEGNIAALRSIVRSAAASCGGLVCESDGCPVVSSVSILDKLAFIQSCTSWVFDTPPTDDTYHQRVTNAIRLLTESDAQSNNAVGLALCMAALEALIGIRGRGLTGRLAQGVGILLEPDKSSRDLAEDYLRKLYEIRCCVLHGQRIEDELTGRKDARVLAAGLHYAVWLRLKYLREKGESPTTPQDLMRGLKRAEWAGELPDFVPDLPRVRELWEADEDD